MAMTNLVSIIMPSFNRGQYIERAIRSVLSQTYSNWELIIVDDASNDNTDEIVYPFSNVDPRVRYIKLKINSGASAARNVAIDIAKGDFITFLDSDDEYTPEKIAKQLNSFLKDQSGKLGVVTCGRNDYKDEGLYNTWIPSIKNNVLSNLFRNKRIGAGTPFLMFSRTVIDSGVRFDRNINVVEDFDFVVQTLLKGFELDFINEPLVNVYHDAIQRNFDYERAFLAREYLYKKYNQYLENNKIEEKAFLLRSCFFYAESGFIPDSSEILSKTKKTWPILWSFFTLLKRMPKGVLRNAIIKIVSSLTKN